MYAVSAGSGEGWDWVAVAAEVHGVVAVSLTTAPPAPSLTVWVKPIPAN